MKIRLLTMFIVFFVVSIIVGFIISGVDNYMVASQKTVQNMQDIITIEKDDYFNFSDELKYKLTEKVSDTEFQGIGINMPSKIDIQKYKSLPLIAVSRKTGLRGWMVNFGDNCILAALSLKTGAIFTGQGFYTPRGKRPVVSKKILPKPDRSNAEAIHSGTYYFDLKEALNIPWKSDIFAVTIFYFDWLSNTVLVELIDKDEKNASISIIPPKSILSSLSDFSTYNKTLFSPSLSQIGADFRLNATSFHQGSNFPLYASFKIKSSFNYIIPTDFWKNIKEEGKSIEKILPEAIVPATVALIGKKWKVPLLLNYRIPVYADSSIKVGDVIEGYLDVDISADIKGPLECGDYCIYFFVDQYVSGPKKITVKSEKN